MTPEERAFIQIFAAGLMLNILWLCGLLAALVKLIK